MYVDEKICQSLNHVHLKLSPVQFLSSCTFLVIHSHWWFAGKKLEDYLVRFYVGKRDEQKKRIGYYLSPVLLWLRELNFSWTWSMLFSVPFQS